MRSLHKFTCFFLASLFTTNCFAESAYYSDQYYQDAPERQQARTWAAFLTMNISRIYVRDSGKSPYFPIASPATEFFNYNADHAVSLPGSYGVFAGAEFSLNEFMHLQLGLNYNQTGDIDSKGTLLQGTSVATQASYQYRYRIVSKQLLAQGKALYNYRGLAYPFVTAGVGMSYNEAYNFTTNAPNTITTRVFSSHHTASLSYSLGFGIEVPLDRSVRAGLGYRFAYIGEPKMGSATLGGTPVSGTLEQGNLFTNEAYAEFTLLL